MDQRIKKLWVKALRSGEFEQTTGQLRDLNNNDEETYCCLGVLCQLAVDAGVIKNYDGSNGGLPKVVKNWAGLVDDLGTVLAANGKERYTLADKNDEGRTFKQIARMIEANL